MVCVRSTRAFKAAQVSEPTPDLPKHDPGRWKLALLTSILTQEGPGSHQHTRCVLCCVSHCAHLPWQWATLSRILLSGHTHLQYVRLDLLQQVMNGMRAGACLPQP